MALATITRGTFSVLAEVRGEIRRRLRLAVTTFSYGCVLVRCHPLVSPVGDFSSEQVSMHGSQNRLRL
jgi:hypothetical protein